MNLVVMLGIVAVMGLMSLYEWPKMKPQQKREKIAFTLLTVSGGVLAALLYFVPDMPGPTELIDILYKPLGAVLEAWSKERSG